MIGLLVRTVLVCLAAALLYATAWFFVSLATRRSDVADVAWGPGIALVAVCAAAQRQPPTARMLLVLGLTLVWAARLALHIWIRNRHRAEDRRYAAWRAEWGRRFRRRSFFQVFLLQGALMVVVGYPAIHISLFSGRRLGRLDAAGVLVWLAGFLFESVADWQLAHFRRSPAPGGRFLTSGLWRFSRHPNYFGEVLLWWGVWIIGLSVPYGWAAVVGPLAISLLIIRVSGVPMLERRWAGDPEFESYRARTSAFVPLPPRR